MSVDIDIRNRLGRFDLDVRFSAPAGLTALFGPSGAGKTSVINIIAGLVRPDHGRVAVDGEVLVDAELGIFVPTHRRRIGYVFQEGRLFPHLTVRQNLVYGRWFAPAAGRRDDLGHVVGLLGLGALLDRRPGRLSGGEKQRVAIGRALLSSPRIILMDEPLASLDEARKAEILPYIERLRDETRVPIVYVSHSVTEVARLATTMAVLAEGRIAAVGPTDQVMQRLDLLPEAARSEAGSVLETTVESHDEAFGLTTLRSPAGAFRVPRIDLAAGHRVRIRVRSRDVIVATTAPQGLSAINVLPGVVAEIGAADGAAADIRIDCAGEILVARLTRHSIETLRLRPGLPVYAVIKSVAFDRRSIGAPMHGAVAGGGGT
ncbi:MAG: molybdenum ABC transporter ATP-binding protein [Alphaproteobacteria bacterium]|nr:molybdenum ABC transporter ATP-binding protein [Alphaproteobacteria bacterium]